MLRSTILTFAFSAAICAPVADLAAQEQPKPAAGIDARNRDLRSGGHAEAGQVKLRADGQKGRDSDGESMEFVDPNTPRAGLERHADLRASLRPRRLAPGQTGTAVFYVAMRPLYAGLADQRFDVQFTPTQGHLTFGPATISEPTSESEDPQLAGLTVYDDLIRIETPVTVAPDTPYGTYTGAILVQVPIQVRRSGLFQGVLQGYARIQVVVGDPLPTFVAPSPEAGESDPSRADSGGAESRVSAEPTGVDRPRTGLVSGPGAQRVENVSRDRARGPVDVSDLPAAPADSGSDLLVYGGAAVLVLLAGALIFGARKR